MKKSLFKTMTVMALGAIVFSSCSKENTNSVAERVPVKFGSSLKIYTRAYDATWEANDQIGVFMVDNATQLTYAATNKGYQTTVGGTGQVAFSAVDGTDIYYPVDGSGLDFFAYYPFDNPIDHSYEIDVDLTDQTSQKAIDFMWGTVANNTKASTNVNLPFDHKLSKVVINIVKGEGLSSTDFAAMTMKITGMKTAASFNARTGVLTLPGTDEADIVPFVATQGLKYEAIVLPETVGTMGMEFAQNNAEGGVFNWSRANETFAAGSKYTYTMTINKTSVTFTCDITPWTDVPRNETAN